MSKPPDHAVTNFWAKLKGVVMRRIFIAFVVVLSFGFTTASQAENFDHLFRSFKAEQYTPEELRFLQLGLSLKGYYNGLLDGKWGRNSSAAMTRYAGQEFDTHVQDYHAALIAFTTADFVDESLWDYMYFDTLGLAMLMPADDLTQGAESDDYVNFEHTRSSFKMSVSLGDVDQASSIHNYAEKFSAPSRKPYTMRKQGFAVTSAINRYGDTLYVRSKYWRGSWGSILLSANERDKGILAVVSASISNDKYASLDIPRYGKLFSVAESTSDLLAKIEQGETAQDRGSGTNAGQVPKDDSGSLGATGSGFYVSDEGHVLTNAHVVERCTSIKVDGEPADLVQTSSSFDLALLSAPNAIGFTIAEFADQPAQLNEDITVAGFPLSDVLGGLNITRGAVSSLKGLAGDEITLQISAPVQPGNSGGPALSSQGYILGIVVSKLNTMAVADAIGDVPQNVNFAIRAEAAKLFLPLNGVTPKIGATRQELSPVATAKLAKSFTAFIECN